MTYSVRHLAPRTLSARTLAIAGAITVSAVTLSALTALGPLGAHAGRSHTRSSVTRAGVVIAGGYPSGYNPFNMPDPTAGAAVVDAANALVTHKNPDFRTALTTPVGSNVLDLRAALYPFSTISPVNPSATGLFP
jgi:hypothetical protein